MIPSILMSSWFFNTDVRIALTIVLFVWILNWAKDALRSSKLGVIVAAVITYLTFYSHPQLVWVVVVLILMSTFGKSFIKEVKPGGGGSSPHIEVKMSKD